MANQELLEIDWRTDLFFEIFSGEHPKITTTILENLDNKSISNCVLVNKFWKNGITGNRVYWERRKQDRIKKEQKISNRCKAIARRANEKRLEVSVIK